MADIKDKIKKLLALAESPNENEAKSALLKARELMAKNKLSDADFGEEQKLEHITADDIKWTTDSGEIWLVDLCKTLAENYCCTSAWSTPKGTRTHTLVITGIGEDARICKEAIEYAVKFVRREITVIERRNPRNSKAAASSYAKGFVDGLVEAFEQQKDEHPEWGLVVVKPQEVQDYENNLGSKNVKTKKNEFDPLAYLRGQKDGLDFNIQKILGCAM